MFVAFISASIASRSYQLQPLETGLAFFADDDVIVHQNTERLRHDDNPLRHLDVGARRRRVAGKMIVHEHGTLSIPLKSGGFPSRARRR